jgi:hypothetical protein
MDAPYQPVDRRRALSDEILAAVDEQFKFA